MLVLSLPSLVDSGAWFCPPPYHSCESCVLSKPTFALALSLIHTLLFFLQHELVIFNNLQGLPLTNGREGLTDIFSTVSYTSLDRTGCHVFAFVFRGVFCLCWKVFLLVLTLRQRLGYVSYGSSPALFFHLFSKWTAMIREELGGSLENKDWVWLVEFDFYKKQREDIFIGWTGPPFHHFGQYGK